MQSFRNNLITPELATEMLDRSVCFVSICTSEETSKHRRKISKLENKKIKSLVDTIFQCEFCSNDAILNCDLEDDLLICFSYSVHSHKNRFDSEKVVVLLNLETTTPLPKDTSSFETAFQYAKEFASFFNKVKTEKTKTGSLGAGRF